MQIDIRTLNKTYPGGVQALRNLNIKISSGMFGLLGPNGAGKSTLMKILATLEEPSSGEVRIDSQDIHKYRKEIRNSLGYLPQFFGVYPQLTGAEFLTYIAKMNGVRKNQLTKTVLNTLERVGLSEARDRKAKTYSGGMLRRLLWTSRPPDSILRSAFVFATCSPTSAKIKLSSLAPTSSAIFPAPVRT
ncbi:MAG: ABC transporter ATP-binding protein [bacterium]